MTTAYKKAITGKVQGDGVQTYTLPEGRFDKPNQITFINHQITVEPDAATVGTVSVKVKAWGSVTFEDLKDSDLNQVIFNLTGTETYNFSANIEAIELTPVGVDDTYNIYISGWE